ncbi:uncharacterized protein LOC102803465 [Saccoglossus kowalevskii]|uniref:PR domain zinc finger protein 4-like n=1 Tax=Saccoglossus kowalevskii TaxID=10224 RepID=A0ABM0MNK8_SACKO|nr:PREDICTED: PR domain zinc finger protein 4-like [Saccoglossus kowalevskii]
MPITTIASERQQQQQPNSQQPISINVNINMGGGGNNMLVPSNRQIGKDTSVSSPNDVTTIHCITTNSNQADAVTMVPINKQADMENILTETLVTELWCVDCECSHCGDCPQHGPLNLIEDTPIESKARMSLPKLLRFQKSMISNHSVGVWTYESLGSRCQFGPLNGKIIKKNDETIPQEVLNSPMVWEIFIDGKSSHYIDGRDESESNWMIFVKRARRQSEQNLVAYQYGNSIYFTTKHSIEPGKELLLWYNREYAKLIGVTEKPEESYKCSKCEKQFADLSQLGRHMKYSHPDMSCRKWKCHMCDRAFTSSAKLNVHVLVHMGVKPHKCEHCDKTFTDPSNLRMHVSIHTGLKKFQCDICGNSFRQKAHLLSHKITHTGEKKLKCQYCDKMFSRHSDVKQHTYMHTKEKEVPCQECGKTFWRLQHLKKHMKVHSGERNYKCEKCQKGFVTKYHLKRHSEACKGPKENKSTTTKTTKNSSTVRMAADSSNEPSKTIDRPRRTRRLRRRNNYDDDEEEQPEDFQRRAHVPQQAAHQTHQPEILQIPQHSSSLLSHQASNVSLGPSTYQTSGMHQPNMLLQSHHLQHPIITVPVTSSIPIIQNLPLTHTIPNTAHNITILPNMPLNLPSMTAAQHNLPTITSHSILPIPSTSHSLPTMQTTSHNMQTMSDEVITNEVCEASSNQEQDAVTSSIEE